MMRSLSSAVAGLRTHQTKMDVIGNNIANVNTYGFKASRTTFQDVYYQNISSGSRAQGAMSGGTNPTQIGYGASVATIDMLITQSGSASTDRALDVFIAGEGFLTAKDPSGNLIYTRLGNLRFDGEGNLVDGTGNLIQGFPMDADGRPIISPDGTISVSELSAIKCDPEILNKLTDIFISRTGAIVGILPGEAEMGDINKALDRYGIDPDSITIPPDSVYSGGVKMVVGSLPSDLNALSTAIFGTGGNIASIDFGDVGLPDMAGYEITVTSGNTITFFRPGVPASPGVPAQPEVVYEGRISNGKIELKNSSGKVAMVINLETTAPLVPVPSARSDLNVAYDPSNPAHAPLTPQPNPNHPDNNGGVWGTDPDFPLEATGAEDYVTLVGAGSQIPSPVAMGPLNFQITTMDKGGNIVKLPRDADGNYIPSPPPTGANPFEAAPGGSMDGFTIASTRAITTASDAFSIGTARTAEGIRLPIGNLALAKFRNAAGLAAAGGSYLAETFNSGEAIFVLPSLEGTGAVEAGYLEMSNVDLSKEFTEMITTQRGFQANSRIVSVSDEMLQELVNLKR